MNYVGLTLVIYPKHSRSPPPFNVSLLFGGKAVLIRLISRSPALDRQMSVVVLVCRLSSSADSKTADIMTLSVSFRYGKWVVPLILLL